jgi:hypothetical protein
VVGSAFSSADDVTQAERGQSGTCRGGRRGGGASRPERVAGRQAQSQGAGCRQGAGRVQTGHRLETHGHGVGSERARVRS